jgi:hypothetical protein
MLSLSDLLRSVDGQSFLEARGVFADPGAFLESLREPVDDRLSRLLELPSGAGLVYVGQQACCDYHDSVTRKFLAARDLTRQGRHASAVLWHDMDRAGSDELAMRIQLPLGGEQTSIRLVPRSLREREPRFIEVGRGDLEEVLRRIEAWIGQGLPKERRPAARARLSLLSERLLEAPVETLAEANRALASWLLREHLSFEAPSAFVSELAERHLLTEAINDCLANIDDFIAVVNEAIDELIAEDVDPKVRPLRPDYLPLRYSCPRDGSRFPLAGERRGADRFAVGTCGCGATYRFHLGGPSPSLGELDSTDRWSPDVSLPIYLNDLAAGLVAGPSSGLYGLVLNAALRRALGRRPIPALIPTEPPTGDGDRDAPGSLLYEYLAA